MLKLRRWWALFSVVVVLGAFGCSSGTSTSTSSGKGGGTETPAEPEFVAPTWEELNASATWIDQPVVDAFEELKKWKAEHPPQISPGEAIGMPNDSTEANEKLVSAFGAYPETDDEVDYEATLTRHTLGDAKSTNPILISSTTEMDVASLTGMSLFSFDGKFTPFAAAETVESWQVSEDRTADKVVMRKDLVWSDGTPITAHDVAFSFHAIMNPEVPAVAVRSGTDQLADVVAYDDHTVVYFHKQSLATNVWNVNFPIIPKHIFEPIIAEDPKFQGSAAQQADVSPVCGGPYKITSRIPQQEIILERRDDYFTHDGQQVRKKPYFKEIRFKVIEDPNTALLALMNGEVDVLDEASLTPSQWVSQTEGEEFYSKCTKLRATEWTYYYFGWNVKVPLFSDVQVRKAMAYAFDYDEMLDKIGFGLYPQALGLFHPDAWMAPKPAPEPYTQNLAKAEELLEEAGWADTDGDGILDKTIGGQSIPFEFTIQYRSGSDTGKAMCTLLKENLDQIGIVCNIKPVEFSQLQQVCRDHKFQAIYAGWGTGTDPDTNENLWTTKAIETNGRNYGNYSNSRVDELFELGKKEFDREKRAKIYGEIATILWEDQPYLWLVNRPTLLGMSNEIRGVTFSPRGWTGAGGLFEGVWKPKKSASSN